MLPSRGLISALCPLIESACMCLQTNADDNYNFMGIPHYAPFHSITLMQHFVKAIYSVLNTNICPLSMDCLNMLF